MFEIPDDDDDLFWQNLPVDEITQNALKSTDGKRQAQETLGHGETKRPRPLQSDADPSQSLKVTSVASSEDASTRRALQMLSNSNPISDKQNNVPTTDRQVSTPAGSVGGESAGIVPGLGMPGMLGGRAVAAAPAGSATPGLPGRLVSSPDGTPLPGPSPASSTPRPSTRKFPGPAGLLPQQSPSVIISDKETASPAETSESEVPLLSSQSGEGIFLEPPWQALEADLGDDPLRILKKFSLAATRFLASRKRLYQGKVPLVLAVLESVNVQDMAASVVLRDRSGQMQGSIHKDLLKEHGADLQPGAAIVLRQVGVLSPTSRKHYLNITPANLVALYPNRESGTACVKPPGQQLGVQAIIQAEEQQMKKAPSPAGQTAATTPRRPGTSGQNPPGPGRFQGRPQQSFSDRVGMLQGQNMRGNMQGAGPGNAQSYRQTAVSHLGTSRLGGVGGAGVVGVGGAGTGGSGVPASGGSQGVGSRNFGTPARGASQTTHPHHAAAPGLGQALPPPPGGLSGPGSGRIAPGVGASTPSSSSAPRTPHPPGNSAGNTSASGVAGPGGAPRFRFRTPTTPRAAGSPGIPPPLAPAGPSTPCSSRPAAPRPSTGSGSTSAVAPGSGNAQAGQGGGRSGSRDSSASTSQGGGGDEGEQGREAVDVPDSLWDPWSDELSDELLSQLSEDMF